MTACERRPTDAALTERVPDGHAAKALAPSASRSDYVGLRAGDDRRALVFEEPRDDASCGLARPGGGDDRDMSLSVGGEAPTLEASEAESISLAASDELRH